MIIRFNNSDFHLSWEVTFEEKINKLKKSNDITFAFNLPETESFDGSEISNINIEVLKGSVTNPLYKWVFYNCNLIQFHIAPSRWSNSKTIFLKVRYEDVIGSHLDGIITSKLRDKKLDDLLK